MRIATWNVNSIRTRVDRVVDWLVRADIDALAMQEIKCKPEQFPLAAFAAAGYEVALHGLNQWNGVAIASRIGIDDVEIGFPGQPGFAKGHDGPDAPLEARAIGATVGEAVRLWSLYVPNGRSLDDPHYVYKLDWLEALRRATSDWLEATPDLGLVLSGDFNIAPTDADNGDPTIRVGLSTHVSAPERAAFQALLDAGLTDPVRELIPTGYTYWDYQQLRFPRNEGLRIDFLLASTALAGAVIDAEIHREERKGEAPSDHVPVVIELAEDGAEDDRPMVF